MESTTFFVSTATAAAATTTVTSVQNELEQQQYFYLSRIRPWCLGTQYDYCPLMIIVMIVVILISVILITILCIHSRKPYITRLLINYIVNKKNKLFRCRKDNGSSSNVQLASARQNSHSAIHNSIFWVNNPATSSTAMLSQHAPPSYEESVLAKPMHLTSILAPIATSVAGTTSSGYNTATYNDAFSCDELYIVPQIRQQQRFRESAIDTIDLPENNYYENRRSNHKNLSFMSTDSFHFINTSASRLNTSAQQTPAPVRMASLRSTTSEEYPPAYDTLQVNQHSFTKLSDVDNLNKFKKLQQKYQQSRNLYFQQQRQLQQANRQSTATILSEVGIIV